MCWSEDLETIRLSPPASWLGGASFPDLEPVARTRKIMNEA